MATHHAAVGLDFDLEHLGVMGAGDLLEGVTTIRTASIIELEVLLARGQ